MVKLGGCNDRCDSIKLGRSCQYRFEAVIEPAVCPGEENHPDA